MIELSIKTVTADSSMGGQSERIGTISLPPVN
jgi:hypothetical protein